MWLLLCHASILVGFFICLHFSGGGVLYYIWSCKRRCGHNLLDGTISREHNRAEPFSAVLLTSAVPSAEYVTYSWMTRTTGVFPVDLKAFRVRVDNSHLRTLRLVFCGFWMMEWLLYFSYRLITVLSSVIIYSILKDCHFTLTFFILMTDSSF